MGNKVCHTVHDNYLLVLWSPSCNIESFSRKEVFIHWQKGLKCDWGILLGYNYEQPLYMKMTHKCC